MDPLVQRLITVIAGILAGWLAQHVPGLDQPTANELSGILVAFAFGWATRHFADATPSTNPVSPVTGERK